ncbi:hypothetical protein BC937DRAFT_89149, partial [Endogone sp. FLAS-F59071]
EGGPCEKWGEEKGCDEKARKQKASAADRACHVADSDWSWIRHSTLMLDLDDLDGDFDQDHHQPFPNPYRDHKAFSPAAFSLDSLPPAFLSFLEQNEIDPSVYAVTDLPRYVRLNTALPQADWPTAHQLQSQLNARRVWQVEGVEGFFGIELAEESARIFDCAAYKDAQIFGIDVSSGIAVHALDIHPDDHILDLCCAPGAKLCMISNLLTTIGSGTVTGVDISPHRAAICRSLVRKYKVGARVRLFVADGTTFCVPAPRLPTERAGGRKKEGKRRDQRCDGERGGKDGGKSESEAVEVMNVFGDDEKVEIREDETVEAREDEAIEVREDMTVKVIEDETVEVLDGIGEGEAIEVGNRIGREEAGGKNRFKRKHEAATSVDKVRNNRAVHEDDTNATAPTTKHTEPSTPPTSPLTSHAITSLKPFWAPKMLRFDPQLQGSEYLYDKVIVDAECTHDGSISHILKRNLLANAWTLLKPGGLLVYSTCSLSVKQNEENVAWFLLRLTDEVELERVLCAGAMRTAEIREVDVNGNSDVMRAMRDNCVRFDPKESGTSGFFVARFRKLK